MNYAYELLLFICLSTAGGLDCPDRSFVVATYQTRPDCERAKSRMAAGKNVEWHCQTVGAR